MVLLVDELDKSALSDEFWRQKFEFTFLPKGVLAYIVVAKGKEYITTYHLPTTKSIEEIESKHHLSSEKILDMIHNASDEIYGMMIDVSHALQAF